MVQTFILVKGALGKDKSVKEKILKVKGIKETHAIACPYNLIANIEVSELKEVSNLSCNEEDRTIDEVVETLTLICVSC